MCLANVDRKKLRGLIAKIIKINGYFHKFPMFVVFVENSLPQSIMIGHDKTTFGELLETHLDKIIFYEGLKLRY